MAYPYNQELLDTGLSYGAYQRLLHDTLAQPPQDETAEKMRPYLIGNVALMDKYDRNCRISDQLKAVFEAAPATTWLIITEGWCGDAAFNVPVIAALEKAVPDKIKLRLFLRDSYPELTDANLTDGGRSIPKLIVLSKDLKEWGKWGPRPEGLQVLMREWKGQGLILKDLIPKVQEWYDADNTDSVQQELKELVQSYC